jgi:hypothetical protein
MAEDEKAPGSAPQDTQLGKKRSRKIKDTNTDFNVASKGSFPGPPPAPRSRHAFFPCCGRSCARRFPELREISSP